MKAIEMIGTIDKEGHLIVKEKVNVFTQGPVKVILLAPEEEEISEANWLKSAMQNEAFEFLKEPQEDIYSLSDGTLFHD
jgi:hypothetical protein